MARNYFIFLPDGGGYVESRKLGIHIPELPPIQRPSERVERIIVPGRSGTLTKTQGENVYDSYTKSFDIIATDFEKIQSINSLLRGTGKIIFSNEPQYRYTVSINDGWDFNRTFRQWRRATILMETFPFKESVEEKVNIGTFVEKTIYGDFGCEVTINCKTDIPCPFYAEFFGSGVQMVFLNGIKRITSVNAAEDNWKYLDNEHGVFYNENGVNMLPWTTGYDFPLYLQSGENVLLVRKANSLKVTHRGWFL